MEHSGKDPHLWSVPEKFFNHILTFHNLTKYGIAKIALSVIEECIIRDVEEELAGRTVFIGGTRHGNRATQVTQAVIRFILDRRVGLLLLHVRSEAPPCTIKPGITR